MAVLSRPLVTSVFRFLLVGLLTFVILCATTSLVATAAAWMWSDDWTSPRFLSIGFVGGMVVWLFVAVFHLRRETQSMPFSQREQFIAKAKTVLGEMGYAVTHQRGDALAFRPRFHSYLFGGGIQVALGEQEARLTGPKVSLEIFRRCFRLFNHVQRVQVYLQDHRRFTDNVIKRVELQLRIKPAQFEAVRRNIIEILEKEADVVCELSLLVHSDQGIRENTIEFQIRQWLEEHDIPVEIHKDLVQFVEVVHPELETEAASH